MLVINEWYDVWRIGLFLLVTTCLVLLARQFLKDHKSWGERDRDSWFMLVMWSLAAWTMQIEGILLNSPLRFRLVFVTAACLITFKLLTKPNHLWSKDNDG